MNRTIAATLSASFAILALAGTPLPAAAQGKPQTLLHADVSVDVQGLSSGYRASKIIGASVYNDSNQSIGKVDDLITSSDEKSTYAVVSVGGFLGMGSKLVVLPYDDLRITDDKITIPGATKETLKALPEFRYAK